jgi:hypothetical protein
MGENVIKCNRPGTSKQPLLVAPGHDYNLSAPGDFPTGAIEEFSTGGNWGIFNRR